MILITTHQNADFDGLASMIAAAKLYPGAILSFPGSQERNVRIFIRENLRHKHNFTKLKDADLERVSTLVLVDTRSEERIGRFSHCLKNPDLKIHIYDHHPKTGGDLRGELEEIEDLGSTTTLLVKLLRKRNIPISPSEATLFALGIYEDTGSLCHLTTTPKDLTTCGWLLEKGAELDIVAENITHEMTSEQISILHQIIRNARQYTIQNIPVVVVSHALSHYVDDCSLIVRRYMAMENINVLFALLSMEGRVLLICRSRLAEINVGDIARELGGGGHATAASATLKDITLIEAEERLLHSLHRHIRPQPIAGEMLSKPAITVAPDATMKETQALLTRYNITAAIVRKSTRPATAYGHGIEGIISRMVVERACHHGLGDRPVTDYMTTDVRVLPLNATLADIQEVIIRDRQRMIPIVQNRGLIGVITRTDLLNHLVDDPAHLPKELTAEKDYSSNGKSRNLSSMMADWFDKSTITLLQIIGEEASKLGYKAYAVGGFVRDLLLKQKNLDLDVVIEGDGMIFAKTLAKRLGGRFRTHKRFRTAVVILPDGFKVDIATARLEYYEYPAAMPTIELSSIKLDLSRRDFTINAMAIHLGPEQFGTLIDFFNCQNDLKQKLLKVLHNLSFVEDPSRIFRAVRFEKRMGFTIAPHTKRLIVNAVDMGLFDHADDPRFLTELKIILDQEDPLPALQRLAELNLFELLWPPLAQRQRSDKRFLYSLKKAQLAISWYKLLFHEKECRNWIVYLLTIMSTTDAKLVAEFCKRFKESPANTEFLITQKYLAERLLFRFARERAPANSEVVAECQELEIEGLLYVLTVARQGAIRRAISNYVTTLQFITPHLSGKDLVKMGYTPGPEFKKILNRLRNGQLDGYLVTKEDEIALVKREFPL